VLWSGPDLKPAVFGLVGTWQRFCFVVPTIFAPNQFSSSCCITTSSICTRCSFSSCFNSWAPICTPINICWVAMRYHSKSHPNRGVSTAIQLILLSVKIWDQQAKELQTLHHLHIHHVAIRWELRYLIGAKMPGFHGSGFLLETSPEAMVWVFWVVRPVSMVTVELEPRPESKLWIWNCY
jgi:hypothetical protein